MMKKTCSKCEVEKDVSCVNRNKKSPDGFHANCRTCQQILWRAYRQKRERFAGDGQKQIKGYGFGV